MEIAEIGDRKDIYREYSSCTLHGINISPSVIPAVQRMQHPERIKAGTNL